MVLGFDGAALNRVAATASATNAAVPATKQQNYYVPKEYDPSKQVNPLVKPVGECNFRGLKSVNIFVLSIQMEQPIKNINGPSSFQYTTYA